MDMGAFTSHLFPCCRTAGLSVYPWRMKPFLFVELQHPQDAAAVRTEDKGRFMQFHEPAGVGDRIGRSVPVIEGDHLKSIDLPGDGDPAGFIDLVHGHLKAVEVILAVLGRSPAQGSGIAHIDDLCGPGGAQPRIIRESR